MIGGGGRLDFTVIGDPVNSAARVETATRETDDDVLVTSATLALLKQQTVQWDERPPIPLKGKNERVYLYAPAPSSTPASSPRRP
jgi:adenylate cyclase